jgi:putative addiction module component (TIGR02574 family)
MGHVPSARDRLLAEILKLPVGERLDLIERIWASLPEGAYDPPLTDEMKAELDRRLADLEENPGDEYTWEEVGESLRRRR